MNASVAFPPSPNHASAPSRRIRLEWAMQTPRKVVASLLVLFLSAGFSPQSMRAQSPAPTPPQAQALPMDHAIHDGTPIKLRLAENLSSADAHAGQEIPFECVDEVQVDGVVVLPKGSAAVGTVTEAEAKRTMGRAGKLDIAISYARLKDNEKVALRATKEAKGGSHTGAMAGAMVATVALSFGLAAPLFLFMKGKDITIPQGTEVTAFVEGDMRLDMTKFGVTPAAPAVAPSNQLLASNGQVSLSIDSTPPGAEIDVDENFVGSTPSTVPVPVGSHEITVRKKGFTSWTRKMNVTGGNVYLNAELDRAQ
jgi:PEGA domain